MKPVVTSIFAILFFAFISSAQDNPCDAIQLECNSTALSGTFDGSTPNPEYPFDCPFNNSPGQGTIWFTFDSDGSQERRIFYSDLYDTVQSRHLASIYEGNSCEELTLLEDCNRFNYFSTLFPAGTYYIQLRQRFSGPDENSYNAGLVCAPIPSNDLICDAIEVECGQVYSDQLIGATESFDDGIDLNIPGEGGDVWFKFEANSSTSYNIIGTSNQSIRLFYAADTCSEVVLLDFSTTNINDIIIDGTVYFSVKPTNESPFSLPDYQVAIQCSPAPENVFICGATEISGTEGTIAGSLVEAPYDQSPCTSNSINNSKWFKFRSDVDGELDLSACSFSIEVVSGSCEDFQCLGLDGIFCPPFSSLTVDVTSDVDYFIRVSGNFDTYQLNYNFSEEVFCPDLGFAGSPCDDGDPTTTEDTITADCNCIGEQIPLGELCETAVPILSNPFFDSNSVGDFGFFEPLEFSYEFDDIPPFAEEPPVMPSPQCYEQGDFVYSFTTPVDRVVSISVDGAVFGTPNATILKGCPFTTTLLAECANGAITDFYAFADTTYYLLIDGDAFSVNSSLENIYELEVRFNAFCSDLELGVGASCDDGVQTTINDVVTQDCECQGEEIFGLSCENPFPVSELPYSDVGSILDFNDVYNLSDVTPFAPDALVDGYSPFIYNGREAFYSYTPEFDQLIDVSLRGLGDPLDEDSEGWGFLVLQGCPFEQTLAADYAGDNSTTEVKNIPVIAGETYYFFVSNSALLFTTNTPLDFAYEFLIEEGQYDCPLYSADIGDICDDGDPLTIDDIVTSNCECSAQPIPEGELCEVAIPILETPYFIDATAGTLGGPIGLTYLYSYNIEDIPAPADSLESGELFLQCFTLADMVFSFSSPDDRVLSVEFIDNQSGGIPTATILTGCPFAATLATSCNTNTGSIVDFYTEANTEYFILVDGGVPVSDGILFNSFEMTVTAPKVCPALDGKEGDSCDDGDPLTENDVITPDCECLGQVPNPLDYCSDPLNITAGPGLTASPILFDATDAMPSPLGYCDGSNEERPDSWFSYEAVSSNMAVAVKGVGDYDAVLEVYDACGGNRIKCRNGGEEGDRETVLVSNSEIGQEYLYRVYERGGNPLNFNSFRTSVTFFPSADIEQADCNQECSLFQIFLPLPFLNLSILYRNGRGNLPSWNLHSRAMKSFRRMDQIRIFFESISSN